MSKTLIKNGFVISMDWQLGKIAGAIVKRGSALCYSDPSGKLQALAQTGQRILEPAGSHRNARRQATVV